MLSFLPWGWLLQLWEFVCIAVLRSGKFMQLIKNAERAFDSRNPKPFWTTRKEEWGVLLSTVGRWAFTLVANERGEGSWIESEYTTVCTHFISFHFMNYLLIYLFIESTMRVRAFMKRTEWTEGKDDILKLVRWGWGAFYSARGISQEWRDLYDTHYHNNNNSSNNNNGNNVGLPKRVCVLRQHKTI